ncbi:MAG TPA: protein kinase [Gemmatimonadales bacterium]|nr:protein kinase [Gemmatimonadales bacterium]
MFCSRCGTEVQKVTQFCPTCGLDLRVTSPVQAIAAGDVTELEIVREALEGEYELVEELGRGGMAIVYRARDKHLEREVAAKILPFSLAFDAEFVERFTREARTAAGLEHPNIIPIYRVGKTGRVIYFVMKLLRGGSLSRVLAERQKLTPAEIRKLLVDVGGALGYAHKRGIVHRDIKPDNVMFDEFGQCVVTDFGIAKAGTSSRLTGTGMSIGTPHYMSPEQARAQSIDGRSDLYSLGIVAYQALVGEVPYDGEDSFSIGYKHIMEPIPVPLLDTVEERRLFEVIKRLIMKDPLDRFQDAEALLKALEGQPRESVAQRRVSAAQALMAGQSTTPLPAQSIMLQPASGAPGLRAAPPSPPSGAPAVSVGRGPDTPRRPVMRRSVAAAEPAGTNWAPWLLALLAVLMFGVGASYLYRHGLLGGTPGPTGTTAVPTTDSATPAPQDSVAVRDSEFLGPELSRFDSTAQAAEATPTPAPHLRPAAPGGPRPPAPGPTGGDNGVLQLINLPPRSEILIDGKPITQPGAGITLAPGMHELAISAPDYQFFTESVAVESGKTLHYTPALSASNEPPPPPGSRAELRRRILARLDCDNPTPLNRFGADCYDARPRLLGANANRVPVPAGVQGTPSMVVLVVKVSRQGKTLQIRTRAPSNEPAFTRAVESYADSLRWAPALRDGQPVDGWTQAAFVPATP